MFFFLSSSFRPPSAESQKRGKELWRVSNVRFCDRTEWGEKRIHTHLYTHINTHDNKEHTTGNTNSTQEFNLASPSFLLRLREGGEGLGAGTESVYLFVDLKTTPNPDYFFSSRQTEHWTFSPSVTQFYSLITSDRCTHTHIYIYHKYLFPWRRN